MFYADHIIEDIRDQNDIVELVSTYVPLKASGSSYVGLCPFHSERTPSFSVNPIKQFYYCFGCGAGGNAYSFVMAIEGLGFIEAVERLAQRVNYILPQKDTQKERVDNDEKDILYKINTEAAEFFYENLKQSTVAIDYLKNRGVLPKTAKKFKLGFSHAQWDRLHSYLQSRGYSSENIEKAGLVAIGKTKEKYYDRFRGRLMFPIFEPRGKVIGFGARSLGEEMPKYLNSPETKIYDKSNSLYALNFVKRDTTKDIIVVEGYMDAIALYQAGFYGIVASLGTAFSAGHGRLISRYARGVVLVFDSDSAGTIATTRAIDALKNSGISIKILSLENAKDPDDYLKKFSKEDFLQEIKRAKNYIDYQIDGLLKIHNLEDTQQKIEFIKQATLAIAHISDPIEYEVYIGRISDITKISVGSIKERIGALPQATPIKKPAPIKAGNKALRDAHTTLINILATNYTIYKALHPHLQPKEMGNELYAKTLQILYDCYEKKESINPAQILNHFDKQNEQSAVASIFSLEPNVDEKYLSKAINDHVKLIKKSHLDKRIKRSDDLHEISQLLNEKNNLENLKIIL